jgi:tetrapyrrole methylase family protein/MazG family protein
LISEHGRRFLRTAVHPSAHLAGDAPSFDSVYQTADTFDDVYREIADRLVRAAEEAAADDETVLYLVPGSPLVLERTVQRLRDDSRVEVVLHPAIGFLDLVWARLAIDPIESNVTLVDGHEFATAAAGVSGPMLVAHCHANWVLSDIKLGADENGAGDNDDVEAIVLHHLGLPDERIVRTTWANIDRVIEADHLTSLYVPRLREPVGRALVSFHELARTLRRECPWDREQTHRSLVTYLLEETYEVVDALLALDPDDPSTDEALVEELGDLLYQIEFHAAIAEQEGRFTMADVASGIREKLIRRHPHVFERSNGEATIDQLTSSWEAIKKAERAAKAEASGGSVATGPFAGVPSASGSLSYAGAVLKKAERAGHPVTVDSPIDFSTIVDVAEHLLAVVAECRRRDIDPEVALRALVNDRRRAVERDLAGD